MIPGVNIDKLIKVMVTVFVFVVFMAVAGSYFFGKHIGYQQCKIEMKKVINE